MIDKPGIYEITNEEYHSDCCIEPCLSRGVIMDLLFKSPAHAVAKHPHFFKQEEDNDPKYSIGQAAHSLFLEGIDKAILLDYPDWRTKEAKISRQAAYAMGKIPLLREQYENVVDMVSTANKALLESELQATIADGYSEKSIFFWDESETWFKIRPDWLSHGLTIILDYKTTDNANPEEFGRKVVSMGYDVQDALYSMGVKRHYGIERGNPTFVFMVQETTFPFLCSFISLDPEFKAMGKQKVEAGIDLWRQCLRTDEWPGYPKRICHISMPPWAANWQMAANMAEGEQL